MGGGKQSEKCTVVVSWAQSSRIFFPKQNLGAKKEGNTRSFEYATGASKNNLYTSILIIHSGLRSQADVDSALKMS